MIDDDAIIHLNVIGGNQSPVVAAPVTAIVHVDQSSQMLDLLESAEDPDGDALQVSNPRIDGDASGVRIEGRMLTVLPEAYDRLFAGEEMVVNVTYDVLDSAGGRAEATARITLVGVAGAVNPLPFRHRRLDVSGDLRITALDALQVFNSIARQSLAKSGVSDALSSIDTNNDGIATAADALKIINYLNRQEARESLNFLREEVVVLWNADDPTDVSEASVDLPLDSSVGLF